MAKAYTYKHITDQGVTTYYPDGSKSVSYMNLFDGGYTEYLPDGTKSVTYKNVFDQGYTTYHPDGSRSITYRNLLDGGYTTYYPDGRRSVTYQNLTVDGYTTYFLGNDDLGIGFINQIDKTDSYGAGDSSIDRITGQMLAQDKNLLERLKTIEYECSHISTIINKVQTLFGDQEKGQIVLEKLYNTVRSLVNAENYIVSAEKSGRDYIEKLRG